ANDAANGLVGSPALGVEHDVKGALEGTLLDLAGSAEGDDDALALSPVANGAEHRVAGVARLACEVHLRGQPGKAGGADLEVDMRGASGIGHGANGAEPIASRCVGRAAAVALKGGVAALAAPGGGMIVDAMGVALPDFHQCPRYRLAAPVEDAPQD